jgi:predicted RNase H-like nuclease (RuvC/YqgF family)
VVSNDALLGAVALLTTTVIAGAISLWSMREARKQARDARQQAQDMRDEQESVAQRKLDQTGFVEFKKEYRDQIASLKREVLDLRTEMVALRGKLRSTWRYVLSLRSVMRSHRCEPAGSLVIPPIPDDLVGVADTLDL